MKKHYIRALVLMIVPIILFELGTNSSFALPVPVPSTRVSSEPMPYMLDAIVPAYLISAFSRPFRPHRTSWLDRIVKGLSLGGYLEVGGDGSLGIVSYSNASDESGSSSLNPSYGSRDRREQPADLVELFQELANTGSSPAARDNVVKELLNRAVSDKTGETFRYVALEANAALGYFDPEVGMAAGELIVQLGENGDWFVDREDDGTLVTGTLYVYRILVREGCFGRKHASRLILSIFRQLFKTKLHSLNGTNRSKRAWEIADEFMRRAPPSRLVEIRIFLTKYEIEFQPKPGYRPRFFVQGSHHTASSDELGTDQILSIKQQNHNQAMVFYRQLRPSDNFEIYYLQGGPPELFNYVELGKKISALLVYFDTEDDRWMFYGARPESPASAHSANKSVKDASQSSS